MQMGTLKGSISSTMHDVVFLFFFSEAVKIGVLNVQVQMVGLLECAAQRFDGGEDEVVCMLRQHRRHTLHSAGYEINISPTGSVCII